MNNQINSICINNKKYEVGKKYMVYSPMDSPFLFLNPTDRELREYIEAKKRRKPNVTGGAPRELMQYTGTLVQVPQPSKGQQGRYNGFCLYFEVEGINYTKEGYRQAEQISLIEAGVVKISEL